MNFKIAKTEFLNAFIQTHGTNNKLLTGILEHWIFEKEKTEQLLHKTPCLLERRTEFEQLTLF